MTKPTIVCDTREQLGYEFPGGRVHTVRRALPAGDYSLEGLETVVAVERKSLADLVGTLMQGRNRFRRELQKLQSYKAACIVVEANLRDLLSGTFRSRAHPNALFGSVVSICLDYGIPVYFCSDRQVACRFVEEFLLRFHKKELGYDA